METSTYRGRLTFVRVHCWSLWSQVINAWWKIPSGGPNLVRQWGNQDMKLRIKRDLVVGQYLHNWQDEYFVIKHGHFFYPSGRKKSGQIARHSLHDVTDLKHWVLLAVKTEVILGRQTWQCHCSINNNTLCLLALVNYVAEALEMAENSKKPDSPSLATGHHRETIFAAEIFQHL